MKYNTLLAKATVEKDVENAYKHAFIQHWPEAQISSPFGTDGLVESGKVRMLCEMKFDKTMKVRIEAMRVLGQLVYYVKKFERAGDPLPNVLFAGDVNECFAIETRKITEFLSMDIDWDAAPSGSHPELEVALLEDIEIAPFVYDVNPKVDFADVIEKIEGLAIGKAPQIRATVGNVERLYGIWEDRIFREKLEPQEKVAAFMKCLFYPEDVYMHPNRKNLLVVNRGAGIRTKIDAHAYRGFFSNFHQGYSPSEIDSLLAVKDTILEESTRRFEGEFYTPAAWVYQAHKMLEAELGSDWKDEYLVIDVAAGVANLTHGYQFKDLILSTLNQVDVDVIQEQGYNHGAIVEKWDFLRESIPKSIEDKLKWAGENDVPVVWFSNPPYGTASIIGKKRKDGIAKSSVNNRMKREKLGSAAQQLYAQFMFQITEMSETYNIKSVLAYFTIPKFLTGAGYERLGYFWQGEWTYLDGMLLPAGDFAGTSQRWGISFMVWRSKWLSFNNKIEEKEDENNP